MSTGAQSEKHPISELWARYCAVFGAAWKARHELAGPARLADEKAFLPAAMSLQETPVHPSPRRAMWIIMSLFALALVWSVVGEVDIVAVAPGRIVVSDRTKVIQPLEPAVVRVIHVKDGDRVKAGQLLIELDPTTAVADTSSINEQLQAAESDVVRSTALLAALSGSEGGSRPRPQGAGADVLAQLAAEWEDIQAKRAKLAAEVARREAEQATAREHVAKLQATLPIARQREADIKALAADGFAPANSGQDRMRERIELERDLATLQAKIRETDAALHESRRSAAAYLAETRRTLKDRASQASVKAAQLAQEGVKAGHRERMTRLTAPVDGTVQQLAVHTTGGVVTAAQPLMVIVPASADATAEVLVDNKDIGFVREGQVAEIKFETFNFTRYGTVPSTVVWLTRDAVADEKKGAVFPAVLKLSQKQLNVDGKQLEISPGMNVTAEIKTGHRKLIEYVISPIQSSVQQSAKER